MAFRVLIIDDDRKFCELAICSFQAIGWEATQANKLSEARRFVGAQDPHLLIVDGLLPDGSGIDLIESIRKTGDQRLIVFVSAFWKDIKTFQRLTGELGVAKVLNKPLTPAQIMVQLEPLIAEVSGAEASRIAEVNLSARPEASEAQERSEFSRQLAQLKLDYTRSLPERLEALGESVTRARNRPDVRSETEEARRLAHNLRGTAGSYGFADVETSAAFVESALTDFLEGKRQPDDDAWEELGHSVQQVLAGLESPAPGSPGSQPTARRRTSYVARLLAVSTDSRFLESVREGAERNMLWVRSATSEDEVRRACEEYLLDGILLDGEGCDAFAIAGHLRSADATRELPIVLALRDANVEARVAATEAGISLCLGKPVSEEALLASVRFLGQTGNAAQPRVLILDDDTDFIDEMVHLLSDEKIHVAALTEPEKTLETLERVKPDLLLLDVVLPKVGGFDLCKMLRSSTEWADLPIIFVSALSNANARLACFESGGDDYIVKPIVEEELLSRVRGRLERVRHAREASRTDALTGTLTRQAFCSELRGRFESASSLGESISLCIVEIEDLGSINDRRGMEAGDRVLAALGRLLNTRFRSTDLRARWSGSQVALTLYGDRRDVALAVVERAMREFSELEFEDANGETFNVSMAVGVSTYPDDGQLLDGLARVAVRRLREPRA